VSILLSFQTHFCCIFKNYLCPLGHKTEVMIGGGEELALSEKHCALNKFDTNRENGS
jgi:hypothetical protein